MLMAVMNVNGGSHVLESGARERTAPRRVTERR